MINKEKLGELSQKVLAKDYGVSPTTLGEIVNCKHWATRDLIGG